MKKIGVVGIVGLPAFYGGFETLVENIIDGDDSFEYNVYCSSKSYKTKKRFCKRAKLHYIPLQANGIQSTLYDIWALIHAAFHNDLILILGVSGCCFLPVFRLFSSKKLIINIDGLEHRRGKWGKYAKRFLCFSEKMAIQYGDIIITDNRGITDYVKHVYNKESELVAYGGDHVLLDISKKKKTDILNEYKLQDLEYSFSVCRIEPENNVHTILEAFEKTQKLIVFVGNWQKSEYGRTLYRQYTKSQYVVLLPPIYDIETLYVFRSNCRFYIHGHSAGGTNPSLVEAMFFSKPILAFDVIYNRETTENKADYFSSSDDLADLISKSYDSFSLNSQRMSEIAQRLYRWKEITKQYESLYKYE